MRKLDIVIPHGGEPWETCRRFFDMLRLQLVADLSQVRVLVVHDGCEGFAEDWVRVPGMIVEQHRIPKGGVSEARNHGLVLADAEWVMFCDCDDMFSNVWALHGILDALGQEAAGKNDLLWMPFYIEQTAGRQVTEKNWIFVHGKLYRREFLMREGIRFHPKLYYAEDSAFNATVEAAIDPERIGRITMDAVPYVWVFNRESVTSRMENRLRNVLGLFDRHVVVAEEYRRRGMEKDARALAARAAWDGYYQCHRDDLEGAELKRVRAKIGRFCARYADKIGQVAEKDLEVIREAARKEALGKGFRDAPADGFGKWFEEIQKENGG